MTPSSTSTSPGTSSPRTSAACTSSLTTPLRARAAPSRLRPRAARAPLRDRRRRAARRARRAHRRRPRRARRRRLPPSVPLASTTLRRARSRSFAFSGATPTIKPGVRAAEPDHRRRRDRVQDELLRRPCLQPRRARDDLRPDGEHDLVLGDVRRASCRARRRAQRRAHRRRAPRASAASVNGVDPLALTADDRVLGADGERADLRVAALGVVLRVLAVAGDDRDDLAGRRAERRPELGRIERGEPPRRAGADVDEPSARREARDDRIDRSRELVARSGNRGRHRRVVDVHQRSRAHASRAPRASAPGERGAHGLPHARQSGVARCVMEPHASYPHVHRSSTPSSRAAATAASSSGISAAVSPKLGSQSCDATPCRSHVSRSSRAKRRTKGPAASFQCFQYGSVANVVSPGSSATRFQSEMPCVPSVAGSRQTVFFAAARGDVGDDLAQEVDDRRLAERLHLGRELGGDRAAEALGAPLAAARPPLGVVDAHVRRHHPRRLVPEDRVDAALERPVGPLLAERAVGSGCSGTRRQPAARRRAPGTRPGGT